MRAREFLSESNGMYNRKVGDEFYNSNTGKTVMFQGITSYPNKGKYENLEQRKQSQALVSQDRVIQWVNPAMEKNPNYLAFAVVEVQDSNNNSEYWGRYFKEIVGNMLRTWDNKEVPPGWNLHTKSAQKSSAGYDPQKLIQSEDEFQTVGQVVQQVSKSLGKDHELVKGLEELSQGQLPVFKGMAEQMPAIRDYFGEIMAPIALIAGKVGGDAVKAQSILLGESGRWSDCLISWPMDMNHNLVDSKLHSPSKFIIGISSKGGIGARASVKNIYDQLVQVQANEENSSFLNQYRREQDYITEINNNSQFFGPINLAWDLGILKLDQDQEFADEVQSIIKNPSQRPSEFLLSFINSKGADTTNPNYNVGYHALSALAEQVASKLNNETRMNEFVKRLLNSSSMLQIYTKMAVKGQDALVTGFTSIFPAKFEGNIKLYANKGYTSTGITQKFVFGYQ